MYFGDAFAHDGVGVLFIQSVVALSVVHKSSSLDVDRLYEHIGIRGSSNIVRRVLMSKILYKICPLFYQSGT